MFRQHAPAQELGEHAAPDVHVYPEVVHWLWYNCEQDPAVVQHAPTGGHGPGCGVHPPAPAPKLPPGQTVEVLKISREQDPSARQHRIWQGFVAGQDEPAA